MNHRPLISSLLFLILLMSSCLTVPVPTKERKVLAGKKVSSEQIAFITPGITTKQEVSERLGKPNVIWEDARVFIYVWEMRQGILFWIAGGGYQGSMGAVDIPKHHLLLIQFDPEDRVLRSESVVRPLTKSSADFLREWLNSPPPLPATPKDEMEPPK